MPPSTKPALAALSALCLVGACSGGNGEANGNGNDAGIDGADDAGNREGSVSDAPASPEAGGDDASADSGAPSACGVPFSRTGPWCYKLPASTPVASNSAAVVANIQTDIKNNYGTFGINTDTYSSPIYAVTQATPKLNWTFCPNMGTLSPVFAPVLQNVPTAAGMVPSMGTDSEITIYDPQADQEWEFWIAVDNGGQWSACWGGTIQHVSTDPASFPRRSGRPRAACPCSDFSCASRSSRPA